MLAKKLWHKSITEARIIADCERRTTSLDNPGVCLICGCEHEYCEPDARNYKCENCGAKQVFGSEELLMAL